MSGRKITITMDEEMQKKLREIQAALLPSRRGTCSFTKVLNQALRVSLEKQEEIKVDIKINKKFGLA